MITNRNDTKRISISDSFVTTTLRCALDSSANRTRSTGFVALLSHPAADVETLSFATVKLGTQQVITVVEKYRFRERFVVCRSLDFGFSYRFVSIRNWKTYCRTLRRGRNINGSAVWNRTDVVDPDVHSIRFNSESSNGFDDIHCRVIVVLVRCRKTTDELTIV